jgi:TolA-binding protein
MTDETLRELGKQLPHDRPTPDRSDGVRASLLAAATAPQVPEPRRWRFVGGGFAAGVLAAAAVAILVLRPHGGEPAAPATHAAYAQIESSSAAALEHTMVPTASGTDELVRVHAGKVRLAVPPTRPGDRVRVTTGDAEIEGSGAYEVVVTADALTGVDVTEGTATLRLAGQQQAVFLAAGQSWRAHVETAELSPAVVAPAVPAPAPAISVAPPTAPAAASTPPVATAPARPRTGSLAPPSAPAPAPAPGRTAQGAPVEPALAPPRPAVTAPTEQITTGSAAQAVAIVASPASVIEKHFQAGMGMLRANKLADAIVELGAAGDAGEGPLASDARYYQAVALVKAKRGAEAERALVQFLDHAPTSIRRGRAAMMLGRLLADRGDAATARTWFELAAKDPDPTVAAAANAALR